MIVLGLNHGLSRITQIARILRSPEQLFRNRGSFGFKRTAFGHGDPNEQRVFSSRNRGSFGFKYPSSPAWKLIIRRFNLVIEVLLISSLLFVPRRACYILFQSRNQDSFDFK